MNFVQLIIFLIFQFTIKKKYHKNELKSIKMIIEYIGVLINALNIFIKYLKSKCLFYNNSMQIIVFFFLINK